MPTYIYELVVSLEALIAQLEATSAWDDALNGNDPALIKIVETARDAIEQARIEVEKDWTWM